MALLTGQRLVVASLGDVAAVLCLRTGAQELMAPHVVAVAQGSESEPEGLVGGLLKGGWTWWGGEVEKIQYTRSWPAEIPLKRSF